MDEFERQKSFTRVRMRLEEAAMDAYDAGMTRTEIEVTVNKTLDIVRKETKQSGS